MVLKGYRLAHVLPCLADPDKIRAIVELDEEIHETFPYINALLKGCIYNHPALTLTLKWDGKMITLYPRKVTIAKAVDENDLHKTMEWLKSLTLEIEEKKDRIKPDFSRGVELKALDIFKLLPGTSCKACDELTCLAFAVKILSGDKAVVQCAPLFTPDYQDKRQVLMELLRVAGYSVPGGYKKAP